MTSPRRLTLALVIGAGLSAPLSTAAGAAGRTSPAAHAAQRGSLGTVLVARNGSTLYHFTVDGPNRSRCSGACAKLWPPLLAHHRLRSGTNGLGTIRRGHRLQVTYHHMPLYRYALDSSPSDTRGQGVDGTWFVVHPSRQTGSGSGSSSGSGSGY